jgi:hypothetical protein
MFLLRSASPEDNFGVAAKGEAGPYELRHFDEIRRISLIVNSSDLRAKMAGPRACGHDDSFPVPVATNNRTAKA